MLLLICDVYIYYSHPIYGSLIGCVSVVVSVLIIANLDDSMIISRRVPLLHIQITFCFSFFVVYTVILLFVFDYSYGDMTCLLA